MLVKCDIVKCKSNKNRQCTAEVLEIVPNHFNHGDGNYTEYIECASYEDGSIRAVGSECFFYPHEELSYAGQKCTIEKNENLEENFDYQVKFADGHLKLVYDNELFSDGL